MPKRYRIPVRLRVRRAVRQLAPLGVWSIAATALVVVALRQPRNAEFVGHARAQRASVAAERAGRLVELRVRRDDRVQEGAVLARLDQEVAQLQLRQAEREVERLEAEIARERSLHATSLALRQGERERELRRFRNDADELEQQQREVAGKLAENRVALAGVEARLRRHKELLREGFRSQAEVDAVQVEHDRRAKRVQEQIKMLTALRARLEAARQRERDYAASTQSEAVLRIQLAPLEAALAREKHRVAEFETQVAACVLHAPAGGRVVAVLRRAGETVQAGEPILEVVGEVVDALIVWVPPAQRSQFAVGTSVELRRRAVAGATAMRGRVRSVGARVEAEPESLRAFNAPPRYGIPVTIELPRSFAAVDGEAFDVRLLDTPGELGLNASPN